MSAYRTVVVGTDGSDSSLRAVGPRRSRLPQARVRKLVVATAYFPQSGDQHAADVLGDEKCKMRRQCADLRQPPRGDRPGEGVPAPPNIEERLSSASPLMRSSS